MPRRPIIRPWTESEIALLRKLWLSGMSVRMIASRIRRPPAGVKKKAADLKLSPRVNIDQD
jgi:hypothetical protein